MKITVIIPTYKPGSYLWKCLDSIKNQTFDKVDFELILVLNGCNEPYYTDIKKYIATNFIGYNINFIQTDVGGVSNARNIALDKAKGKYITFIDDDDYVSPKYLEELYKVAAPDTVSLSYPYAFNDGEEQKQISYGLTNVYEEYSKRANNSLSSKVRKYFSGPWMKLIPMSFIQDRRFDVRFKNGEDSLFMFLISDKIDILTFASRDAVYYRRYRENSAVTRKRTKAERITNTIRGIREYCRIYSCNADEYNFVFFITRILAEMIFILKTIVKSK